MHNTGKPFTTGWIWRIISEIVIGRDNLRLGIRISKAMSDQGLFFIANASLSSGGINFITNYITKSRLAVGFLFNDMLIISLSVF